MPTRLVLGIKYRRVPCMFRKQLKRQPQRGDAQIPQEDKSREPKGSKGPEVQHPLMSGTQEK